VDVKLSRLPRAPVFYLLDQLVQEYPEDFEAWLAEYLEEEEP
jgi:hypothetical protein